jgi:hypothetical protein
VSHNIEFGTAVIKSDVIIKEDVNRIPVDNPIVAIVPVFTNSFVSESPPSSLFFPGHSPGYFLKVYFSTRSLRAPPAVA